MGSGFSPLESLSSINRFAPPHLRHVAFLANWMSKQLGQTQSSSFMEFASTQRLMSTAV